MCNMAWETLRYPLAEIDNAGQILVHKHRSEQEYTDALEIIDNWRAVHAFPLNTMQMYLRKKASIVDPNAIVAQRIKRLTSIELKLRHMSRLKLSEMQDVGGCRAVVKSVAAVERLVKAYHDSDDDSWKSLMVMGSQAGSRLRYRNSFGLLRPMTWAMLITVPRLRPSSRAISSTLALLE